MPVPHVSKDRKHHLRIREIVNLYKIDYSDALQLITVLEGRWKKSVYECKTVFVSADSDLVEAARSLKMRVWHFGKEEPPTIAQQCGEGALEMHKLNPHMAVRLRNETCPYCGANLVAKPSDDEHTIARRFVPKGTLDRSWNLILLACQDCNGTKGDLEDDLSAISMQPDAFGNEVNDDPRLLSERVRKGAGSFSRVTKKPVQNSDHSMTIQGSLIPGLNASFSITAPPQFPVDRALHLAQMQLSAFFYFLTYDESTRRGGFSVGEGVGVNVSRRSDWGNPVQISFMRNVCSWDPWLLVIAADGYFKVAIRRHPEDVCWSWALEWNQNIRLVGFYGEKVALKQAMDALEFPDMTSLHQADRGLLRFRTEISLDPNQDLFFGSEKMGVCRCRAGLGSDQGNYL